MKPIYDQTSRADLRECQRKLMRLPIRIDDAVDHTHDGDAEGVEANIVTLIEELQAVVVRLSDTITGDCPHCGGSGRDDFDPRLDCPVCRGVMRLHKTTIRDIATALDEQADDELDVGRCSAPSTESEVPS